MLHNLTKDLDLAHRTVVRQAHALGLAYVWGRQDAGDGPRDNNRSEQFALVYAEHVRDYVTGQSWWQTNLHDAYMSWTKHGEIRRS